MAAEANTMGNWRYLIVGTALVVAVVVFEWAPAPIKFGGFDPAKFTQQMTPLFLVALLIERSLEVFITTWRGPKTAKLQNALDSATKAAIADPTKIGDVNKAKDALTDHKSATQGIAMPSALMLGLLVGALGIRCLGNLLDPNSPLKDPQKGWFTLADVWLTGSLVGGGSDVVHSFITAF